MGGSWHIVESLAGIKMYEKNTEIGWQKLCTSKKRYTEAGQVGPALISMIQFVTCAQDFYVSKLRCEHASQNVFFIDCVQGKA